MESDRTEGWHEEITVSSDVRDYINSRRGDFRVCTTCGGAMILSTCVKPPKQSDIAIPIGDSTLFISKYQAQHLHRIHEGMIPIFYE